MRPAVWVLLGLTLLLGFLLRFYRLDKVPPSLDWDEVSLGWNAYSLLRTGTDEYGNHFPLAIRSFGDYKPPLYVYSLIPTFAVFGKSDLAVRLPSAAFGTAAIIIIFLLARVLFSSSLIGLLSALILAVTPWGLQFSRGAFEANLGLFLLLLGHYFLLRFLKFSSQFSIFGAGVVYALAIYSYHSYRLVIPVFLIGVGICYLRYCWQRRGTIIVALMVLGVLVLPIIRSTLRSGSGEARFSSVSIFTASGLHDQAKTTADLAAKNRREDIRNHDPLGRLSHSPALIYTQIFLKNYLDHLNFDFLFLSGDGNGRQHAPEVGVLLLSSAPFLLWGLVKVLKDLPDRRNFLLLLLLTAPIASALTTETPHAIRALALLPPVAILTARGLKALKTKNSRLFLSVIVVIFGINLLYYFHQYFVHFPVEYAPFWQYGYRQAVTRTEGLASGYSRILVTKTYDQPYIFYLFYGSGGPIKNDGTLSEGFGKIRFVNFGIMGDTEKRGLAKKTLIVAAPDDPLPPVDIVSRIFFPDGRIAFILARPL